MDTISRYPIGTGVNPQFIGSKIYWTTESGEDTSKFWEFTLASNRVDAQEISLHIPGYLPPKIRTIVGSKNSDMLCALSDSTPGTVWTYHSTFVDDKRMQAAWSRWDFDGDILHSYFLDDALYIVIERDGVSCVERLDLANTPDPCGFSVCLDSRITAGPYPEDLDLYADMVCVAIYDDTTNLTTFTKGPRWQENSFNYKITGRALVAGENTPWPGRVFETRDFFAGESLQVEGNLIPNGDEVFYLGYGYDQTIELSRFVLSTQQSSYANARILNDGRTQLKTLAVYFSEAGKFLISHDVGGDVFESTHTPTRIESQFQPPAQEHDGSFRTDIGGNTLETTTTFSNNTPIPTKITGLRYEVQHWSRGAKRGRSSG